MAETYMCRNPLLLLVLVWFALLGLDLFLVRDLEWTVAHIDGKRFWANFLISAIVLWAVLYNLRGLGKYRPKLSLVISILLSLTYFVQSAYFGVYRKFVSIFDFRFFSVDPWLSIELWWVNSKIMEPLLIAVLAFLLIRVATRLPRGSRWVGWSKGVSGLALFLLVTLSWYGAPHFQVGPVAYAGNFIGAIEFTQNRDDYPPKPELQYREQAVPGAPDIVFVIGESLNVNHMGVYGYERDTTPNLSRMAKTGEVFALRNAVSIGPRTLCSVPYMMTGLQGIDPEGVIYSVPTIFNYAKSAGYQTALITAQDFQWRGIDKIFVDADMDHFEQGSNFSADVSVSVGANDMDVLKRGVGPFLESAAGRKAPYMLVTQMSGSHTPFSAQVPQEMKQFLPEPKQNSVNAYDNTVWYTDHYLNELVNRVRQKSPDSWIFYSTDHGEHVSEKGGLFHSDFTNEVTHNALLVFPPPGYQAQIGRQLDAPVSQADIFATILELMQVKPVAPLDGLSLLGDIPADRLRVVTAFMKTLHNDPRAALVFPDRSIYEVDFERKNVRLSDGETVIPYAELDMRYRTIFERRMKIEVKE
ncbi:phosphoethanolamine transferase [Marinobacterium lacunae]|uniref:phosphoethanolamine transferase n=1 Tax=Marinobacterium lacunae TaxID=1232683 RepID=UPI0009E02C23|nr:phosphoethanolamine transferase [Marinobacterium lacunae]